MKKINFIKLDKITGGVGCTFCGCGTDDGIKNLGYQRSIKACKDACKAVYGPGAVGGCYYKDLAEGW
jgi:hypothetical protein